MSETNPQDISNTKILADIANYMKEAPGLRFGQILFNLDIMQFAEPNNPEAKNFLCRDLHSDSNEAIIKRIQAALKREKEEN